MFIFQTLSPQLNGQTPITKNEFFNKVEFFNAVKSQFKFTSIKQMDEFLAAQIRDTIPQFKGKIDLWQGLTGTK